MKENNKNVEVQLYFKDIPTSNLKYPTSNSAITLIALIITIIVLLILAGVTLNMLMGENGIINKAQLAKEKTNQAQEQEKDDIKNLENKMDETLQRNGSSKFEVLWENTNNTPISIGQEFELKEEFTKYDVLCVSFSYFSGEGLKDCYMNTTSLKEGIEKKLQYHWICTMYSTYYCYINFDNTYKKCWIKETTSPAPTSVLRSIGIKF